MRGIGVKKQLLQALREESGFTLTEMMVTVLIMIVMFLALGSIFDMSLKVFMFGNNNVEATENARVALERMEREIRAAYPYNSPDIRRLDASGTNTTANKITFFNDLDGNGTGNAANETISFYVEGENLLRKQGGDPPEILTPLGPGGLLEFMYFDKTTGATIDPPIPDENAIGMVRIKLVVVEDGGANEDAEQELITNAALRNRGD
jgi:competence protein ComGC